MKKGNGRICFLVPALAGGGAERVVSVLASQLVQDGQDAVIIKYFEAETEYPVDPRVKVVCLAQGDAKAYNAIPFFRKIRRLRGILRELEAEYVVPMLPHIAVHVDLAGFGMRKRLIQTVRIVPDKEPSPWIRRVIRDFQVAVSYATFVQTESQKAYFPSAIHHKIVVLPNPVSAAMLETEYAYPDECTELITMGRLAPQKNFSMLIRAVKNVREAGKNVRLSIYGEGKLKEKLLQEIEEAGCTDCCFLRGRTGDVASAMKAHHLFILPSNYEGMPNALMEAMAVGLPCISTDCKTGPAELIRGENGILVPVDDEQAMTQAILRMLQSPAQAAEMGRKARQFMLDNYSPRLIASRFMNEVVHRQKAAE